MAKVRGQESRSALTGCGRARCVVGFIVLALCIGDARADEVPLPAGSAHDAELVAGQHDRYRVMLPAGQAAELSLQQNDAMLHLRWSNDAGAQSLLLLTQAGRGAALKARLVADKSTEWTIDIAAAKADRAASYHVSLGKAHAIVPADRESAAADVAFAEAETIRLAAGGVEPGKQDADLAAVRIKYDEATRRWRSIGEHCAVLTAQVGLARLELAQARYPESQAAAEAALASGCDDSSERAVAADRAAALRTLAAAQGYQGDFEASAAASESALALYRQTGDLRFQGVVLGNLSAVYRSLGEAQKALDAGRAALDIATATKDAQGVAFSRENIANSQLARGELAAALTTYRQTLGDLQATPYPMTEGMVWNELGSLYRRLGEGDDAREAWARSRKIWETTGNRSGMAETWINEGEAALDDGAAATAAAAFTRALDIAQADRLQSPQVNALRGLGQSAMAAGRFDEASAKLQESLTLAHAIGETSAEAAAHQALGDLDSRSDRRDSARQHYDTALEIARRSADVGAQAAAEASLARTAADDGDLEQARSRIERALAVVEAQRAQIADPDLRTGYFATQRAYFDLYIDVLMRLDARRPGSDYAARALEASEHARARSLQDMLSERSIAIDRDVAPELLAAERAAEDQQHTLAWRLARLGAKSTLAERTRVQHEIDSASRDIDAARGRIRAAHPRYAELAHPMPLPLDEIRTQLLDADASVLEYWLGESRSYLWIVTRDGLHAFTLPARATIETAVRELREKILSRAAAVSQIDLERRAEVDAADAQAADRLAAELARQIVPDAARGLLRRDVVVVADGELQSVPFDLFDLRLPNTARGTMTYLPSIGTLRGLRALPNPVAPRDALAILADPVFDAADERAQGLANVDKAKANPDPLLQSAASEAGLTTLPRLTHTRTEALAIAALVPGGSTWTALDFAASRPAALAATWSDYSIVHFATHALLNARHPELSGIVLSLLDASGHAEDGFLRINDIYNLRIPAELVVLSVCDSAVGKNVGAEGPANLARAFFYAGTRRVVASLWPVDDQASVEFMRAFYGGLIGRHQRPQDALVDAQDAMRHNPRWSAPYYWSGYVLQGDWK